MRMPPTPGIHFIEPVCVPGLDRECANLLSDFPNQFLTRHFDSRYLKSFEEGYFRFGTVAGYKSADMRFIGRLGDHQEGRRREVYRSTSGIYSGVSGGRLFLNNRISGSDHPIVFERVSNDYCSCSSLGKFSIGRAQEFREHGNADIGAYAVYDLMKLRESLSKILLESNDLKDLVPVGRPVIYGEKDVTTSFIGHFYHDSNQDQLEQWSKITFVKAEEYKHEEEFRLLLIHPARIGGLNSEAPPLPITDRRIADCIVDSGIF